MASDSGVPVEASSLEGNSQRCSGVKCIMHLCSGVQTPCERLTEVRWDTFRRCASEWKLTREGTELDIINTCEPYIDKPFCDIPHDFGFHPSCYRRFIDRKRIESAIKRTEKSEASRRPPSPAVEVVSPRTKRKKFGLRPRTSSSATSTDTPAGTRRSSNVLPRVCIICKKTDKHIKRQNKRVKDKLVQAETKDGGLLRQAAEEKSDEEILRHIREKDCVAIEVRYHQSCYRDYTRFLSKQKDSSTSDSIKSTKQMYIHAYRKFADEVIRKRIIEEQEIIRMTKLVQLFVKFVKVEEGVSLNDYRADQLKYFIRKDYPQLRFHKPGLRSLSEMVFTESLAACTLMDKLPPTSTSESSSSEHVGETDTSEHPEDISGHVNLEYARTLYGAGIIVKQCLNDKSGLSAPWPPTSHDLNIDTANEIVPVELYNLLAWCIGASDEAVLDSKVEVSENIHLKLLSVCQDIIYLASKGRKQTPKSLALGLAVRHLTGSSQVLELISRFGHCASWDTIVGFETGLAELQLLRKDTIPQGMASNVPTIMIWDNIDFGEETLSGSGTTHHTNGIMVQRKIHVTATDRPSIAKGQRTLKPQSVGIEPFHLSKRQGPQPIVMAAQVDVGHFKPEIYAALKMDFSFLTMKYGKQDNLIPGWTGFNTILSKGDPLQKSAIHYLPVIEASPNEMSTVNAIFQRSLEMADNLNLDHIVLVFDQAIYAKAQQIRWKDEMLSRRCVVRLGEFHTAMSFLGIIGKRFKEAGLQDVMIESEIVAQGSINGVMNGHHYNRSMRAHKLMFEALEILRLRGFLASQPDDIQNRYDLLIKGLVSKFPTDAVHTVTDSPEFSSMMTHYSSYIDEMKADNPTFALWSSYIEMVQTLLVFIRATRQSDWKLHLAAIRFMMPWYFAYDRMNYSRYLPAYWVEMLNLPSSHPQCHDEFTVRGSWTVQRQNKHQFSSIACDQAIEQTCNRDSKSKGGITGITLKQGAVQRWILSQPERAAITRQCEMMAGRKLDVRSRKDLDQTRIMKDNLAVECVISTIESMINPFTANDQLVSISSGVVGTPEVRNSLLSSKDQGETALQTYISERLLSDTVGVFSPIKSLKPKTFGGVMKKCTERQSGQQLVLKNDCKLFKRLLIISQNRKLDLRDVLSYSLGSVSFPLASVDGSLAKTNKAVLLQILEARAADCVVELNDVVRVGKSALLLDGMALLQALKDIPSTFGELADRVLQDIIKLARRSKCARVDFVTDCYPEVSIKDVECSRRAVGGSQIITIYGKEQRSPGQWKKFMSCSQNKVNLIEFFYSVWADVDLEPAGADIDLFIAHGHQCHVIRLLNGSTTVDKVDTLACDHEEADTRLLLHASHAANELYRNVIIKSPDTDVAIIALSLLSSIPACVYFLTGQQNKVRLLDLRSIAQELGQSVSSSLIGLHVFTGCDTTSAFYGKGKRKTFAVASGNELFLKGFSELGQDFESKDTTFQLLEKYVCHLYGQKCSDVNEARYKTFCVKTPSELGLPPTKDALYEHFLRANYQAAIHRRALQQYIDPPSPVGHGWHMHSDELQITWMTRDPAPESVMKSVHCSCKSGKCDGGRCSCHKAKLYCIELCKCVGCLNIAMSDEEFVHDLSESDCSDSDDD